MREPVAITGLGAVTPLGIGVSRFWNGLLEGVSAVRPITRFATDRHRTQRAAEVPFEQLPALDRQARLSLSERFAVLAAQEAFSRSGAARSRLGVFFGCSAAGMLEAERWYASARSGRAASISLLVGQQNSAPAEAVARALGARGPVTTLSSACASATLALGAALDALHDDLCDVALAGGADALAELTFGGFNTLRSVDPEVSRPFRPDRVGLSLGEGAGALILERLSAAQARGAQPLALLAGCGSACDAHHMTAPEPSGAGAARAIVAALDAAALEPESIDFVNAHATGTGHNDSAEWNALVSVFGARAGSIPITATKPIVGHFLGSAGAVEALATVLALREGRLPGVPETGPIDQRCPVDLVIGASRPLPGARHALSINLAFGGSNAAAIFSRYEP